MLVFHMIQGYNFRPFSSVQISDISQRVIMCGHTLPRTFYSISNEVTVEMKSGAQPMGFGFSMIYSEETNGEFVMIV